jgi:hypothetical protein
MKRLIGILFLLTSLSAFAQKKEAPLVQFTGVVYNADSTSVIVPYVSVTNISQHNAVVVTNFKGYFSFVAHEQDSLQFTAIGYAPVTVVIPADIKSKSYTVHVLIKPQITNLPMVRVYFVNAKIADDDLEIARKNISRSSITAMTNTLPRDGQEIQSANSQYMHQDIVNSHSRVNPLLNPLAWGSLIKSITDGDSK